MGGKMSYGLTHIFWMSTLNRLIFTMCQILDIPIEKKKIKDNCIKNWEYNPSQHYFKTNKFIDPLRT